MKKKPLARWRITGSNITVNCVARSAGRAVKKFRKAGIQTPTDENGGWKGVSINCLGKVQSP